jgi:hypothetical protein
MRHLRILGGIIAVICSAPVIQAQQPPTRPQESQPAETTMVGGNPAMMAAMDSLDHRLDSLVDRMNRAGGNQKVAAMAAVINELVAQRRMMRSHMRQMMGHKGRPSD